MIKSLIYFALFAVGAAASFSNVLIAAITNIEAYLLNPPTVIRSFSFARYQFVAAIALIFSVLFHRQNTLKPIGREGNIINLMWAYVGVALMTTLWAVKPELAFERVYDFSKTILLASLLIFAVRNEREMGILRWALLLGVFHAAFMHTEGPDLEIVSGRYRRETGVLPDTQGMVMVIFTPMILLFAMFGTTKIERIFCWCALPFVLNSVVETYQRAYFVALTAELVLLLIFLPKRVVVRLMPALAVGLCLMLFVLTPQNYWNWMGTIQHPTEEASANSRLLLYKSGWKCLTENPLGVGYRNFHLVAPKYLPREYIGDKSSKGAHSTFISVACQTGFLGFAVWAAAVGGTLLTMRRIRKHGELALSPTSVFAMAIELGIYGWLVGGLFHSQHESDPAYWFLALGVVVARLHGHAIQSTLGEDS